MTSTLTKYYLGKCTVNHYKANVFSAWYQVGTNGNCKVMERKADQVQTRTYVETTNCGGINVQNTAKIVKQRKNECKLDNLFFIIFSRIIIFNITIGNLMLRHFITICNLILHLFNNICTL